VEAVLLALHSPGRSACGSRTDGWGEYGALRQSLGSANDMADYESAFSRITVRFLTAMSRTVLY
jgi:hypothetical protein